MSYSVLIVDDDSDFNSLLTDIFEQADYLVTSMTDPEEAIEVFRESEYDVVVTDQRMPEISGEELMKEVKAINAGVPVIMVSGYLENDTIRDLIREGVGGVFLKPLNIFSLLQRTNELIDESKRADGGHLDDADDSLDTAETNLGFPFHSFPCKTDASHGFAERLYSLRSFKYTLSLIGEQGTRFRAICEDLRDFYEDEGECFVFLNPSSFSSKQLISLVEEAKLKGASRVTCVLLDIVDMDAEQKAMAISIPKGADPFSGLGVPLRAVFCVSGDIDELLADGIIDDNLYIMIGTAEIGVPPLRDCPLDVAIMAQQLVADMANEKHLPFAPRLEKSARDLLSSHTLERNYDELREIVERAMDWRSGDVLTGSVIDAAINFDSKTSPRDEFDRYITKQKEDIKSAVGILLGGDESRVEGFFATSAL